MRDMFKAITCGAVCSLTDCKTCHEVYGITNKDDCPRDNRSKESEVLDFIKRVYDTICRLEDDNIPFYIDVTEDDLIHIMEENL